MPVDLVAARTIPRPAAPGVLLAGPGGWSDAGVLVREEWSSWENLRMISRRPMRFIMALAFGVFVVLATLAISTSGIPVAARVAFLGVFLLLWAWWLSAGLDPARLSDRKRAQA